MSKVCLGLGSHSPFQGFCVTSFKDVCHTWSFNGPFPGCCIRKGLTDSFLSAYELRVIAFLPEVYAFKENTRYHR